jgi:hypothetical protein
MTACSGSGKQSTMPRPGVRRSTATTEAIVRGGSVRATIVIDGGLTFAPPPRHRHAAVTASQAWNDNIYKHWNPGDPIDPSVGYQLGIMSSPPGITGVLAWGFTDGPFACPLTQPLSPPPDATPSPPDCLAWTFVDATTGRELETTLQLVG